MKTHSKMTTGSARIIPAAVIGTGLALGLGVMAGCPVEETPRREPAPTEPTPPPQPGAQPSAEPGAPPARPGTGADDPYGN